MAGQTFPSCSLRFPHILIISTIILSLLSSALAEQVFTRNAFHVLTNEDPGGSWDSHRAVVDPLLQEVFDMTTSAIDALDAAKKTPTGSAFSPKARVARKRILHKLQELFLPQMTFANYFLKIDDNSAVAIDKIKSKRIIPRHLSIRVVTMKP